MEKNMKYYEGNGEKGTMGRYELHEHGVVN